jgi:hypothetical protein
LAGAIAAVIADLQSGILQAFRGAEFADYGGYVALVGVYGAV